jgi:uncharacterized protein
MLFEWDEAKRKRNLAKHGVDFVLVADMDWENAIRIKDERRLYGEDRYSATGYIGDRLYVCVYTERGLNRRIISLRKANQREKLLYDDEAETFDE